MFRFAALLVLQSAFAVQAEVSHVDNQELKQLIAQGVPLIDVRTAPEWRQTGVVEGSHLITFFDEQGRFDLNTWLAKLAKVADKDKPFILICRSGNRTGRISRFLDEKLGYPQVINVKKGIRDWIKSGNPIAKAKL